ncbi:disease resistance protein SUMM2-like [Quercus lobata]|uniref:disease resistance protein SUMM2-like n=1 Tax=Quercus lobata TaxID=97700 RepID=UPI001246C279|nr:disease resistance protein SUMM2-like [Quercus lobata]
MLEQTGAIGNIVPVAAQYGHGMVSYLKSKCDYVRNLSKNFDKLKTEEKRLCDIEKDVINEKERNPTMEMTSQCSGWLTEVQKMKDKIQDLRNRYDNTSRRLCGFYPFRSLLKLGKDIVTMTGEIILLREEEKKFTKMEPRPSVSVIKKHPMKINDMPSLDEHVERLIMCLKNDKLKTIGVFGLPGMGKTTVMEHLNDRVGELFEIVFYVTLPVPEMEIVEGIQKKIVEQLNLQVQGHLSSSIMADIISIALANKKHLLLLDQVSSKINLKKVGIHVDKHIHGRVVFACRDRSFCEFTDEEIEIKGLSEVDAKKLFREIVGDIIDQRKCKIIGKKLLDFCSGVPHFIKLIAVRFRNVEDHGTWKSLLNRMRTPSKKILEEMEEFYKAVELIYDSLSKDRQPCLLHSAIFPPDSELYQEYLIECWIGERLIAKNAKKLRPARDEGHEIVTEFESKYLVERCRKAGHFKMPQFLQQIYLKLAYNRENNSKFLVAKGEIEEQQWEDVKRVSLIRQMSFTLPDTPACSEISTLFLQKNPSLTNIPDLFFKYMRELCVLDLYDTRITSLPPSISSLINLRVLYLNNCVQLVELPSQFGKLKSLEILDLRGTGILSLPTVLAQMTGLKCLRVSFKEQNFGYANHINGQRTEMIPSRVIENLSSLQELSIDVDFKNQIWNQIVDRVATEVATLKELTSLCFYFPTLVCFQTFIQNCMLRRRGGNCLKSFRIQVGNHKTENFLQFDFFGYKDERHLRISGGEVISVELSKLFNLVTTLELFGHDSENLSIFSAEELNLVEVCTIKECNEMKSMVP